MVVVQKERRIVVGDPDLEDRLGRRGDLGPQAESVENPARAEGDRRAAPVETFAEHRLGILAINDRDSEPGAGAGDAEQQPDQTAAGDQQLDIVGHHKSMERLRQAVQIPIAPVAFATARDRVVLLLFCAVGGWTALGEGRHRRGAAWPDR